MLNDIVNVLNGVGLWFCRYAFTMLIQSSVLFAALFLIDLLLRRYVRAVFRYWL